MKLYNIHDLAEKARELNEGILGDLSQFEFMDAYNVDHATATRMFEHINYTRIPLKNRDEFPTVDEVLDEFQKDVKMLMFYKGDNYRRLVYASSSEYDPKENYDRLEVTTRDNEGVLSKQTGSVDTKNTSNLNTTAYSVPNDSHTEKEKEKTTISGDGESNKTSQHFNDVKNETDTTETINSHVHGNIGVTESTTMVENYARFWADFNSLKIIFEDIVSELCYNYWGVGDE